MISRQGVSDVCRPRHVPNLPKRATPMLLPSFSYVANDKIDEIFEKTRESLTRGYLVSAYDLRRELIPLSSVWNPDIVFVDSGSYEEQEIGQLARKFQLTRSEEHTWNMSAYSELLNSLLKERKSQGSHTVPAFINLDAKAPFKEQVARASDLFKRFPECVSDFLCRPGDGLSVIDVDELIKELEMLDGFDILGLTEKELGASMLERCENLLRIRASLSGMGLQKLIHIFGCLDPVSIVSYFLCGADIFDGLNWLKFGFIENLAMYKTNYFLSKSSWIMPEKKAHESKYAENIKEIGLLESRMQQFADSHSLKALQFQTSPPMAPVRALVEAAGLDLGR